jgi:UDP-glucose 4-epimerase
MLPVDICDGTAVRRALNDVRPTAVCHLAAAGLTRGVSPALVTATNVLGTHNVLTAIQSTATVSRAVFAGSWYEYGPASIEDPARAPQPTSVYGISKLAATQLVKECAAKTSLSCVVVRPFQVFGPDEPLHRLIPDVLRQAAAGESVRLQNPKVRRDWVYVEDVAEAFELALGNNVTGSVDIGTGVATSVREVVEKVLAFSGHATDDVRRASERASGDSDDARLSGTADVRPAQELLGWTARHDLATGLRKTVDWYRQNWQRIFTT